MKFLTDFFNSGSVTQQKKRRMGAMIICATAVVLVIALVTLMVASIVTAIKGNQQDDNPDDNAGGIPNGYTTTTIDPTQLKMGNLLLVDADHACETVPTTVLFDGHESRAKTEGGSIIYSIGGRYNLAATDETVRAFNAMIAAFYADEQAGGDTNLYISNAYDQKAANQASDLYALGTTIGLKYYVDFDTDASNIQPIYGVEKYEWIYENAANYGFIQVSNAEGEEHIFRYIGVAHATYMKNRNVATFAEYLTMVQTRTARSPLSITVKNADGSDVRYNVYYLSATEEAVVPSEYSYTISGDNMSGYIVTVERSSKKK